MGLWPLQACFDQVLGAECCVARVVVHDTGVAVGGPVKRGGNAGAGRCGVAPGVGACKCGGGHGLDRVVWGFLGVCDLHGPGECGGVQ